MESHGRKFASKLTKETGIVAAGKIENHCEVSNRKRKVEIISLLLIKGKRKKIYIQISFFFKFFLNLRFHKWIFSFLFKKDSFFSALKIKGDNN